MCLRTSMPKDSTSVTRISWKRSTVRPGKWSASPKIRREQAKSGPMTVFR